MTAARLPLTLLLLPLALALAGCGGLSGNRSLDSLHQPVIEHVGEGSEASVPGCPDWSAKSDVNLGNATHSNYGCAVNGNLAAMVADPEDLVRGANDTGHTGVMTAGKAIASYRAARPTGEQGLAATSTQTGGGQQQ